MKMKEKTNVKVNMLGENNEGVLELEVNLRYVFLIIYVQKLFAP